MTHKEFLEQYILTRVSHKKSLEQLLEDAESAWAFIQSKTSP